MAIDYTTALQNLNQNPQRPLLNAPEGRISSESVASVIDQSMRLTFGPLNSYTFPFDYTDRFFCIMRGELTGVSPVAGAPVTQVGNFNTLYRLPYPTLIQDTHDVKYDHNFNWLQNFGSVINRIPGGSVLTGAGQAVGQALAGVGYAVNNFKALTLSTPNFRTFSLEFRLFPKSREESDMLQRMIVNMKTYMHPPLVAASGIGLLFQFPSIFQMWFNTGNQYLFRFKPCVINAMQVNYQGDNPVPSFYRNPENHAIPEGIVIRLSCIELEVWTRENFINSTDGNGLLNNNPLSALAGNPNATAGGQT